MRVRRIVPNLQSADPAAGAGVYEEVLGLDLAMDLGWVRTYTAPDNPTAQITVAAQDATADVHADVSVEVDDVEAAYAAAQRLGCEIVHPLTDEPWGVRRFFVREPGGRVINVLTHASGARP